MKDLRKMRDLRNAITVIFTFQSEATGVVLHLLRQQGLEPDQDLQGEQEDGWCNWECRYVSDGKFEALQTWANAAEVCGLIRFPVVKRK